MIPPVSHVLSMTIIATGKHVHRLFLLRYPNLDCSVGGTCVYTGCFFLLRYPNHNRSTGGTCEYNRLVFIVFDTLNHDYSKSGIPQYHHIRISVAFISMTYLPIITRGFGGFQINDISTYQHMRFAVEINHINGPISPYIRSILKKEPGTGISCTELGAWSCCHAFHTIFLQRTVLLFHLYHN